MGGTIVNGIVLKDCSRSQELPWSSNTIIQIQKVSFNASQNHTHHATIFYHSKPKQQVKPIMSEATGQEKSVKRTILQAIPIPALPGWEHRMVLLEYPAGVGAPTHHHPIAGPNYVVQGSIISQWEGDAEPRVFHAGDSFLEYADLSHTRAENVSQTEDLKVVACYVVKVGEPNVVMG